MGKLKLWYTNCILAFWLVWIPLIFLVATSTLTASEFVDITETAGLSQDPSQFQGPLGLGTGVAFGDYNNDGFLDLYIPNGEHSGLYQNRGDGSFVNVALSAGVQSAPGGAIWGDYNNDGFLDLFINCWDFPEILYRNNGDGTFMEVTQSAGISDGKIGGAAAFVDYDNDGNLDLYVGNYTAEGGNVLYHNNGDGTFIDVTFQARLVNFGMTLGICFFDFDNDNDSDLYLANDFGSDYFYRNLGDGRYENISYKALGKKTPQNSMGIAVGDYDGDGLSDLYITDIGANMLYHNTGKGYFEEVTKKTGVTNSSGIGWGTGFFDYDLDGTMDLYVINGDLLGASSKSDIPNKMYLNLGNGVFSDISGISGIVNPFVGRGSALADYDNDGDVDLFIGNEGGRNVLLRNDSNSNGNNWIIIQLIGVESNRSAIGTRILLTHDSITQSREIYGGGGYLSFDSLPAEFGLGSSGIVTRIEVRWPSGRIQVLTSVPANQSIAVIEGESGYVVRYSGVATKNKKRIIPKTSALLQNYPNPFNPETWIPYHLSKGGDVTIDIYNVQGQLVRKLSLGRKEAGIYIRKEESAYWDGRNSLGEQVSSGIYFYTIQAGQFVATRKMVVLK